MNTMSIRISPGKLRSSDAIDAWTERKIRASLRCMAQRVTRVEVHFADLNGPKEGKADLRCTLEARMSGRKPIAVEHRADNLYAAIDGAARKLRTALRRAADRVATRGQRRARTAGLTAPVLAPAGRLRDQRRVVAAHSSDGQPLWRTSGDAY